MYANYLYVNNHLKNLNNSMSQKERDIVIVKVFRVIPFILKVADEAFNCELVASRAMNGRVSHEVGEGGSQVWSMSLSFDCFVVYFSTI